MAEKQLEVHGKWCKIHPKCPENDVNPQNDVKCKAMGDKWCIHPRNGCKMIFRRVIPNFGVRSNCELHAKMFGKNPYGGYVELVYRNGREMLMRNRKKWRKGNSFIFKRNK